MPLPNKTTEVWQIALCGVLIALALVLGFIEHLLPVQAVVPVPGIKLGLANLVTLFALAFLKKRQALYIVVARCLLQSILFGNVSALLFSLSGGLLALICMAVLFRRYNRWFSLIGISIAGAASHNIGQIVFAIVYFHSISLVSYLPFLLLLSIPTGFLTGLIGTVCFPYLHKLLRK